MAQSSKTMRLNDEYISKHFSGKIFNIISEAADDLGVECYAIGGYVRDMFLFRPSKDIDVVTVGKGIELAQLVAKKLGKGAYLTVFKNFGTAQIKYKDLEVEFVGARKESYQRDSRKPIVEDGTLEDDQNRRDFTINALAVCLNKDRYGDVLDPFNGFDDLENLIIRTPLDPDITFSDDPLRMLRAIRFSTQLGFDIEAETFDAIARNKDRIEIISGERIIDELNKIVLAPKPSVGFILLDKVGLLEIIFPELIALKGAETKDGIGHKDNFYHTLQVLDNIALKTDDLWLRWSAILHDIAKPATKRWDQKMVSLHMRPIALVEDIVSDSAVRRLLFEAGDDIDDLMTLCQADITSKNPQRVRRHLQNFEIVKQKMKDIEEKDHVRNFEPPIDGAEIMELFQLTPSPEIGRLKSSIKDAILDGVIPNEYDAAYEYLLKKAKQMGLEPKK